MNRRQRWGGLRGAARMTRASPAEADALSASIELLSQLPCGVLLVDCSGRVVYANARSERITRSGLTRAGTLDDIARLQARTPEGDPLDPEDSPLARSLGGEVVSPEELAVRAEDGSVLWLRLSSAPLWHDGEIVGATAMFDDVTAEKQRDTKLSEQRRVNETLIRIAGVLSGNDLQTIVQKITDEATALCGAQFGAFFYNVLDETGERYLLYALSGVPRDAFSRFPMPRNTAVFEPTFSGRAVVRSDDITKDPRYGNNPPYHGMPEGHLPVRSYLAVPVKVPHGEVLGGLFFGHERTGVFFERHEAMLVAVAGQAAVSIDNARLVRSLREREARFEAAQHLSLQGFDIFQAVRNREGVVVDFAWIYRNPAAERLEPMGTDFRGRRLFEALPQLRDRFEDYARVIETGAPLEFESPSPLFSGERWLHVTVTKLHDGLAVSYSDVTDRKRWEREQATLVRAGEMLGTTLDYQATLSRIANVAVPDHADFAFVDLLRGDGQFDRVAAGHARPEDASLAERFKRTYSLSTQRPGPRRTLLTGLSEILYDLSDDVLHELAHDQEHLECLRAMNGRGSMTVPLTTRRGLVGAITLVSRSRIYDRRDVEFASELARRAAMAIDNALLLRAADAERCRAEEASRLKDEFLATVSHELRTPLSAILGWATILMGENQPSPERVDRAIKVIERNARAQLRIIEDILDVARIVRGQLRLEPVPLDLHALASEVVETVRPAAAARTIEIQPPTGDRALVVADADRLRQVLWNLVNNAVKFTPEGGHVALSIDPVPGGVTISIRDSGKGIDPSFLPHVFDRFRQGDSGTSREAGGLGLGLSIVRHLVEMHGGSVTAASQGLGKGATFVVTLPVKPFTVTEPTALSSRPPSVEEVGPAARVSSGPRLSHLRVLVVDDEQDARDLITMLLENEGAGVETAASADEALARLSNGHFDVVVSDIGMPHHDGYWLVRRIRESGSKLRAIALTAFARREDANLARSAGFDEHLGKPVDPARLVDAVAVEA